MLRVYTYSATTDIVPSGYSDTTDIVTPQSLLATYLRSTVTLASSGCIRMYLQHRYSYTTDIVTALGHDTPCNYIRGGTVCSLSVSNTN